MGIAQTTKSKLFREIEQLSNPYLIELQNFIRYLIFKQTCKVIANNQQSLKPENDPILHVIGLADVTPFSDTIDDMLYG